MRLAHAEPWITMHLKQGSGLLCSQGMASHRAALCHATMLAIAESQQLPDLEQS